MRINTAIMDTQYTSTNRQVHALHAYAVTHRHTHTHLNSAVIEEPAGQTHDSRVTPVVDEQLRLMYPGHFTRQLAVQVVEAHKEGVC